MFEEESFYASELATAAPVLDTLTMSEEETLSTSNLETGVKVVDTADITEDNKLGGDNIITLAPVVDKAIKYGDHLFYMEELVGQSIVLGAPFWNPDFARIVNVDNRRIGTRTGVANNNSVQFNSNNNAKVG